MDSGRLLSTGLTLEQWRQQVNGRLIDRDRAYGAQCWDLAADYAERVAGCPIGDFWTLWDEGNPDHTLVSSMWLHWPVKPGIVHHFQRLSRFDAIQAGDVLIWARSPLYRDSHIAVALAPESGGRVWCVTQNPGATHNEALPVAGLLGILRPAQATRKTELQKILEDTMTNPIVNVTPRNAIMIGRNDGRFVEYATPMKMNSRGIISAAFLGGPGGSTDTIPSLSEGDFTVVKTVWAQMCEVRK
jgi:hypothetical protein